MSSFVVAGAIAGMLLSASPTAAQNCTSLLDAVQSKGLTELGNAVAKVATQAKTLTPLLAVMKELPENDKVTIFAPDNEAFDDATLPTDSTELLKVILDHVVSDFLPSSAITAGLEEKAALPITSLTGPLTVTAEGGSIMVSKEGMATPAKVTTTDLETCVGMIHVIDSVIMAGGPEMPAEVPAEMPPVGTPAPVPADMPTEMPEEEPAELPAEMPAEMPETEVLGRGLGNPELDAEEPEDAGAPMEGDSLAPAPASEPSSGTDSGTDSGTGEVGSSGSTERNAEIEAPSSAPNVLGYSAISILGFCAGVLL